MRIVYAFRYFLVVAVVPRFFIAGFVITVAAAAAQVTSAPSASAEALTPIILLQMFAAPSGFQLPARRGYYDLLLTSGVPRWQIAVAHCLASVAPGLLAWLCVALLELAATHGRQAICLAAGTCIAVAAVSTMSWAVGVFASRAAAGMGWLLVMSIPPIAGVASPLHLVGETNPASPFSIAVLLAALIASSVACLQIVLGEARLEAAQ